jgi:hypothetical protein
VLKRRKNQDNQDKEEKMFNKGDKVSVLDEAINEW